jgi:lipopolysaccharide assembly protein A
MRWVHLTIIIVFAAATLIFALQNLKSVTVSFLEVNIGAPLAVVVFVVYALGAVTGGSLFALLRRSYAASRGRPAVSS